MHVVSHVVTVLLHSLLLSSNSFPYITCYSILCILLSISLSLVLGRPSSFFLHLFSLVLSVYPVSVCAYSMSVLQCTYLPVPVVDPVTFI